MTVCYAVFLLALMQKAGARANTMFTSLSSCTSLRGCCQHEWSEAHTALSSLSPVS